METRTHVQSGVAFFGGATRGADESGHQPQSTVAGLQFQIRGLRTFLLCHVISCNLSYLGHLLGVSVKQGGALGGTHRATEYVLLGARTCRSVYLGSAL